MAIFNTGNPWKDRALAAGAHLGMSLAVAALAAGLVFFIWYPYPYREISGGRELFFLVVAVDVVLGPLLTFAIFNHKKPWKELKRDLSIVVLLQLAALAYGLWTVAVARPVHLVFEYNSFRPVHAIDMEPEILAKAPKNLQNLPWTGPSLLGLRPLVGNESAEATMAALSGAHLSMQAQYWQPYEASRAEVLKASKPMAELRQRFAKDAALIDQTVKNAGKPEAQLVWLPMHGRKDFWTVLLDAQTAQPLAYMPLDSF
jgi:hypothetical protein